MPDNLTIISNRSRQIIKLFMSIERPMTVIEISQSLKISKRLCYYSLKEIDNLLESLKVGSLQNTDGGYLVSTKQIEVLQLYLKSKSIITEAEDRVYFIICSVMYPRKVIRIDDFTEIFQMSRNTILNDLLQAKEILNCYKLTLKNSKKMGYYVEEETFLKRTVLLHYLSHLLKDVKYENLEMFNTEEIWQYHQRLQMLFREFDAYVKNDELIALSCLIQVVRDSHDVYNFTTTDMNKVCTTKEFKKVSQYFPELNIHDCIYLSVQLLGLGNNREFLMDSNDDNIELFNLSQELVDLFELLACLSFDEKKELVKSIYFHLKLSDYIYRYSIPMINPLLNDVKRNYSDLFEITKQCCENLKEKFSYPIFDSEIAYITMYFGSFVRRGTHKITSKNVLIVCPTGRMSSVLLKTEILSNFENINVVDISSIDRVNINNYETNIDFVISSVDFNCKYPIILVNPILTDDDKLKIAASITTSQDNRKKDQIQLSIAYDIIRKYTSEKVYEQIHGELRNASLSSNSNNSSKSNLMQMLYRYGVFINTDSNVKWEDAIKFTSQSLIKQGCINDGYVDKMIKLVNEYGPYIVISPRIAIAHAQMEDNVKELGLALTVFPKGLILGKNSVQFLFVLATPNQIDHLHILQNIISLSESSNTMDDVLKSSSENEILDIINKRID